MCVCWVCDRLGDGWGCFFFFFEQGRLHYVFEWGGSPGPVMRKDAAQRRRVTRGVARQSGRGSQLRKKHACTLQNMAYLKLRDCKWPRGGKTHHGICAICADRDRHKTSTRAAPAGSSPPVDWQLCCTAVIPPRLPLDLSSRSCTTSLQPRRFCLTALRTLNSHVSCVLRRQLYARRRRRRMMMMIPDFFCYDHRLECRCNDDCAIIHIKFLKDKDFFFCFL